MAEPNQITCPHCGQPYAVRPEQWAQYHGRTINCTKCGQAFVVTAPFQATGPAAAPPPLTGVPASVYVPPPGYPPSPAGYPPQYPPQYPPPGYPPYPQPFKPTSGWATAGLIFGILGFCLPIIGSLLGIVFGIIGITKTRDNRAGGRGMAVAGLSLGIVSLLFGPLMIAILLPALNRAREQANRVKCAADMRMLGQAMFLYANANGDQYPDNLEGLLKTDPSLSPAIFVCPASAKTPPDNSSPQKFASDIASGQHTSYIYLGKGLNVHEPAETVLIYEPLEDHAREGMNVLFGDGHVQFLDRYQSQTILDERSAGTFPVLYPAGKSAKRAPSNPDSAPADGS